MFDKDQLQMAIRACDYLLTEGGDFDASDAAHLENFRYDLIDLLRGNALVCYWSFCGIKNTLDDRCPKAEPATQAEVRAVIKRAKDEYCKDEYYPKDSITAEMLNDYLHMIRREAAEQKA